MDSLEALVVADERPGDARAGAPGARLDRRQRTGTRAEARGGRREAWPGRAEGVGESLRRRRTRREANHGRLEQVMTDPTKTQSQQPTQRVTIDDLAIRGADNALGEGPNAVMHTWFQLFRTAQIHAIDNQALQRPIVAMVEMTNDVVPREGHVSFQAKDKSIFVNGTKLRLSTDEYELAGAVFDC